MYEKYAKRVELIVLQSTTFCNIDCGYCYLPDRDKNEKMAINVIERLFFSLVEKNLLSNKFCVTWHAGEPLVVGLEYYHKVVPLIRRLVPEGYDIEFSIQTNGTLINNDWIDFFKENKFTIGLSLDGPMELNDLFRITRSGKSTFADAVRGLRLVRDAGIPYSVISVLNSRSLENPEVFALFFDRENVPYVSVNFPELEGINTKGLSHTEKTFTNIFNFVTYFNGKQAEDKGLKILQIEEMKKRLLRPPGRAPRLLEQSPFSMLSIDAAGKIYTFSPELLGFDHMRNDGLSVGTCLPDFNLHLEKAEALALEIERGRAACEKSCNYYDVCGGGHPCTKFFETGAMDSTTHLGCQINIKMMANAISLLMDEGI